MRAEELLEELTRGLPRVTAITGGGGKTTLLHALGEFLARRGRKVVLTTTTHFGPDSRALSPDSPAEVNAALRPGQPLLCAYPQGHRMTGLPVEWYPELECDYILVEADGSRCRPLKVHRSFEPVLPPDTGLLLQVAGLSALGRPVGECVHCWEAAGLSPVQLVDEELMAALLLRGFDRTGFDGPRLAILNQADNLQLRQRGQIVAERMMDMGAEARVTALKEGVTCSF